MDVSSDYKDLFRILNKHKVKFLVVGAYAVIYYTEPRYTKDMDIWVKPDENNARKIYNALKEFGAPLKDVTPEDFANKNMVYQIGIEPVRIDIIMGTGDIKFNSAWKNRTRSKYGDTPINIMGRKELVITKKKANRPQDRIDLNVLTATPKGLHTRKKRK